MAAALTANDDIALELEGLDALKTMMQSPTGQAIDIPPYELPSAVN